MHRSYSFRQPATLKIGEHYKLRIKNYNTDEVTYENVYVLSYTSDPGVIVVKTEKREILRVSRDEIYEISEDKNS